MGLPGFGIIAKAPARRINKILFGSLNLDV